MGRYLIKQGCTFVLPDGTRKGAGEFVELPDDVAALHADKLDAEPDLVQTSAPAER